MFATVTFAPATHMTIDQTRGDMKIKSLKGWPHKVAFSEIISTSLFSQVEIEFNIWIYLGSENLIWMRHHGNLSLSLSVSLACSLVLLTTVRFHFMLGRRNWPNRTLNMRLSWKRSDIRPIGIMNERKTLEWQLRQFNLQIISILNVSCRKKLFIFSNLFTSVNIILLALFSLVSIKLLLLSSATMTSIIKTRLTDKCPSLFWSKIATKTNITHALTSIEENQRCVRAYLIAFHKIDWF